MRTIIITLLAALTLSATATAADTQAQKNTLRPKLSITPKRVEAGERFTLNARGFNPNATVTVFFAIAGEAPYASYTPPTSTLADGSFSLPFVFAECRQGPSGDETVALTLTLVDSFGVHASAPLTLC